MQQAPDIRRINNLKADLYGQVLMLAPLTFMLFPEHSKYAFLSYFSVGIWQSLSCYTSAARYPKHESSNRHSYRMVLNRTLAIAASGGSCALFANTPGLPEWLEALSRLGQGLLMMVMLFGLVLSPFLAIWYFIICMDDLKRLRGQSSPTDNNKNSNNES